MDILNKSLYIWYITVTMYVFRSKRRKKMSIQHKHMLPLSLSLSCLPLSLQTSCANFKRSFDQKSGKKKKKKNLASGTHGSSSEHYVFLTLSCVVQSDPPSCAVFMFVMMIYSLSICQSPAIIRKTSPIKII